MAKRAWLTIWTDPGRETEYVVWLSKQKALENVARGIYEKTKREIEEIGWDEEDLEKLRSIVTAFAENRPEDVISQYEDWREEKGPLDEDVDLLEVEIGE